VVEDDAADQRLLTTHVKSTGARVDLAHHGIEALGLIGDARDAGQPYDLIICDMELPEMNGYTLVRTLRGRGIKIPVLAVTAATLESDREKCMDAGCCQYLPKPIERRALVDACTGLLRRNRTARAA
jgi:CheY-like chemotaxis protein